MEEYSEQSNEKKTPEQVLEELDYIMYPERELDKLEAEGFPVTSGGAYDYFISLLSDRDNRSEYEAIYNEIVATKSGYVTGITSELLDYKQKLLDYRLKLEEVEETINIREYDAIIEATMNESRRVGEKEISNGAAIDAYIRFEKTLGDAGDETIMHNIDMSQRAEKEREQELLNKMIISKLTSTEEQNKLDYLVRGAVLFCNSGTHSRHLDMLNSHGVYVNEKAVAYEDDNKPEENIPYFGHCKSALCTLTETISLTVGGAVDAEGNYLAPADDAIYVDIKCKPTFRGTWLNTHQNTRLPRHKSEAFAQKGGVIHRAALTTGSYIICEQGGVIYPLNSGQYDSSYYQAPFMAYPYEDFGSDTFRTWCEDNNISPYIPGETSYCEWNMDKIDAYMQKSDEMMEAQKQRNLEYGYNDIYYCDTTYTTEAIIAHKKAKKLCENFLEEAYKKGLDTMPSAERIKFKSAQQKYLTSRLFSDKERKELEKRYSGMRLDFGSNDQKSKSGYIYEDPELYDGILKRLSELEGKIEEIRREPDNSYNEYESRGRIGSVRMKARAAYDELMMELVTYGSGYGGLTEEQRCAAEEVHRAFYTAMDMDSYPSLEEDMSDFAK